MNFSPDGRRARRQRGGTTTTCIVDYESRTVTWTWGVPDTRGRGDKMLNLPRRRAPARRRQVPHGRHPPNCRVLIIDPKSNQDRHPMGQARPVPPRPAAHAGWPNGATPMDNGDILVSEITMPGSRASRARARWYGAGMHRTCAIPPTPSPPPTAKRVIVADFSKARRVVIFDPATGKRTWEYFRREGEGARPPSLARRLPRPAT